MTRRCGPFIDSSFLKFLFDNDYSIYQVCQITQLSSFRVEKFFKENGYKARTIRLSKASKEVLLNLYRSGKSTTEIGKLFDITSTSVLNILHKLDEPVLQWEDIKFLKGVQIDQYCFSDFTREYDSYFYGFILGDGSLDKNRHRIKIGLNKKDLHILQELKSWLKSSNKISETTKDSLTFSFSDKLICNRLREQNLESTKSGKEKLPKFNWIDNRDFWRGLVDADGSFFKGSNNNDCFSLVGSKEICLGFRDFAEKHCNVKLNRNLNYHVISDKIVYIKYNGKCCRNIARVLYKDSKVHLIRKYNKFLQMRQD